MPPEFHAAPKGLVVSRRFTRPGDISIGQTEHIVTSQQLTHSWRKLAEERNFFATPKDSDAFFDELLYMMVGGLVVPGAAPAVLGAAQDTSAILDADHPDIEDLIATGRPVMRATNQFIESIMEDRDWNLRWPADGRVSKTIRARDLWEKFVGASVAGFRLDSTTNEWHTVPKSGRINGSAVLGGYVFLDSTAAHTATIDLGHFFDAKTMVFDVDSFRHAARLWTVVLELIAPDSEFRPIGLGFKNLAAGIFMVAGIAYDSPEARAIASAVAAILTGEAYAASAEMAKFVGAFPKFDLNRSDMLRVVRNHRRATYNAPADGYEKLSTKVAGIDQSMCPVYLLRAARTAWDRALELGEIYGFRNAQVSFLNECEIEPVKKLEKDVVVTALTTLRYEAHQIEEILRYIFGAHTLAGAPHINHTTLAAKGLTPEEIAVLEQGVVLPQARLSALGFSENEIIEANAYLCGWGTLDGAKYVKPEHQAIFALKLSPLAVLHMMAAVQPFLSGAIDQKITLEPGVGADEIKELFLTTWRLGLKGVMIIRTGSRAPEPENIIDEVIIIPTMIEEEKNVMVPIFTPEPAAEPEKISDAAAVFTEELLRLKKENEFLRGELRAAAAPLVSGLLFGQRRALPATRKGITVEAKIGDQQVYLRTGEYIDGTLGEIFIDMYREGAAFRSVLNCFAIAISIGLQHGVPLEKFVEKFSFTRFEPSGFTTHPSVKKCTSILDYIFRVLAAEYLGKQDLQEETPPSHLE